MQTPAYTTSVWTAAAEAGKAAGNAELLPLNVIEVNFKKVNAKRVAGNGRTGDEVYDFVSKEGEEVGEPAICSQ